MTKKWAWIFPFLLIGLAACQSRQAQPDFTGRLDILGPKPGFNPASLPADWITGGITDSNHLSVVTEQGVPAVKISSSPGYTLIARRISANLLATPYLSWSWNISPYTHDPYPVRLIIGLGKNPSASSLFHNNTLPAHDRLITLGWGRSALQRGTLKTANAAPDKLKTANYIVRGGDENTATWWFETVDLSEIYAKTWPGEDMKDVKIVFVGMASTASKNTAQALISGLRLSH